MAQEQSQPLIRRFTLAPGGSVPKHTSEIEPASPPSRSRARPIRPFSLARIALARWPKTHQRLESGYWSSLRLLFAASSPPLSATATVVTSGFSIPATTKGRTNPL